MWHTDTLNNVLKLRLFRCSVAEQPMCSTSARLCRYFSENQMIQNESVTLGSVLCHTHTIAGSTLTVQAEKKNTACQHWSLINALISELSGKRWDNRLGLAALTGFDCLKSEVLGAAEAPRSAGRYEGWGEKHGVLAPVDAKNSHQPEGRTPRRERERGRGKI